MGQYRVFINSNPVFGASTGENPWDYNATEPDGTHVDGHPPYLFDSGTAGTGSDRRHRRYHEETGRQIGG